MDISGAAAKMGAGALAPALSTACDEFGIDTPLEIAHFLGQLSVESGGFHRFHESLDYSAEALRRMFSDERISDADCHQFGRGDGHSAQQEAIANTIYGGLWGERHLGNLVYGDGWKYRGIGPAQLTGRANIHRASIALFGDDRLLDRPELLLDPGLGARSAGWFWSYKNCDRFAAKDNVVAVTRAWNGGINAVDQRAERTRYAKKLLGVA